MRTVQAELCATVLWSIWKSRNLGLWENVTETKSNIVARAKHLIEDWRFANKKQQMHDCQQQNTAAVTLPYAQQNTVSRPGVCRWQRPARGRFKCNIDASFSTSTNKVGLGMCIRDEEGRFVLAKTMWFSLVCSVDIGEALGLYHAVRWVHDLQLPLVDFKVNSKRIVDYFKHGNADITEVLLWRIQGTIALLTNSIVEFTRRQPNEVAHELAQAAFCKSMPQFYYESSLKSYCL
ncbi:uncharacterized protein [Medicago truncatula]|uniref:uncharacterized protein n=1 Tax=Medicago truncatula TaxID=3880 RepID=UPI001968A22D|nr:uncharacterized protein LOC120575971 [Medicago truncatula]